MSIKEIHETTKRYDITIDINAARKVLELAGYNSDDASDDEVFEKVLSKIKPYSAAFKLCEEPWEQLSGMCGENLVWSFDDSAGVLTISGTGDMTNWASPADVPWYPHHLRIKTIIIGDEVTTIGADAFAWCESLTNVTMGSSVTAIGLGAFGSCYNLVSLTIPESVRAIEAWAFSNCTSLSNVEFKGDLEHIDRSAFLGCPKLIRM